VQVDGRLRDRLSATTDLSEAEAREQASSCAGARRQMDGRRVVHAAYVPLVLRLTPSPR
jgi:hypothetical protein